MSFEGEVAHHDARLRALGLEIWIGAEPTFTRPESQDPCWLFEAEGGDKEEKARALLLALAPRLPGAALCRAVGRQYPEEERPRFSYGARWRRGTGGEQSSPAPAAHLREQAAKQPLASAFQGPSPGPGPATGLDDPSIDPPPPDPATAWLTVTPDPGVVEVNMAPAPGLGTFLAMGRDVFAAADESGLSPIRYRYNGQVADSGGGGQITLGGPTPEASPFLRHPQLLPGLLRYLNRHPSLSYWFAMECIGSASQGPRPDEGVRERFEELGVALDRLTVHDASPDELWQVLAPLLVDCSGNSHRAELNVEKLWNPHFAGRGKLGLVEFRALRMEPTPERMAAVAALLRALAARLVIEPYRERLVEWGPALHHRFALPHFLAADLRSVLSDLEAHGVGLGPEIAGLLLQPRPPLASVELEDAVLTITQALEFWPLVGDVASQERSGARLVDSSTERVQVLIRAPSGQSPGRVSAQGFKVPLSPVDGATLYVAGVRYRAFLPRPGLHPGLAPHDPVALEWDRNGRAVSILLHGWIPGGGVYDGLPRDASEAEWRRRERVVVRPAAAPIEMRKSPGADASLTVDLRRASP